MGKSLYIQFLAENLEKKQPNSGDIHVTIPLHGPIVTPDTVLELFKDYMEKPPCCIFHIDVALSVRVVALSLSLTLDVSTTGRIGALNVGRL